MDNGYSFQLLFHVTQYYFKSCNFVFILCYINWIPAILNVIVLEFRFKK